MNKEWAWIKGTIIYRIKKMVQRTGKEFFIFKLRAPADEGFDGGFVFLFLIFFRPRCNPL